MLPFLGATVLSITDDALYVYKAGSGAPEFIEAVSWEQKNFPAYVAGVINGRCAGKRVIILHDSVEQYYRKERIFTAGVGTLDREAMVSRKLAMVFPTYNVRTSIALKKPKKSADKDSEGEKRAPSDVFLFAAIAGSDALNVTTTAIERSNAAIKGLGLLPLESIGFVEKLAKAVVPKNKKQGQWSLFMGQQRNGNLRQVVVKDGELALTRTTQLNEGEGVNNGDWARDVAQEFDATMNYLARLGFRESEGLDVMVAASQEKVDAVAELIDEKHQYYGLTPKVAAGHVGIAGADKIDQHYTDQLHVGWVAKKFALSHALSVPALASTTQARMFAELASVALFLGALYGGYLLSTSALTYFDAAKTMEAQQTKKRQLDSRYKQEVDKMAEQGVDVPLVQATEAVYLKLIRGKPDVVDLIQTFASTTARRYSVEDFSLVVNERFVPLVPPKSSAPPPRRGRGPVEIPKVDDRAYEARIQLQFPDDLDPELGNADLRELRSELRILLPDYEVEVSRFLPAATVDGEGMTAVPPASTTSGAVSAEEGGEDAVAVVSPTMAEIMIKGGVVNE